MPTPEAPPPYTTEKYTIHVRLRPTLSPNDTDISYKTLPWSLCLRFVNVDAASMQKGLHWTTENLVTLVGYRIRTQYWHGSEFLRGDDLTWKHEWTRVWYMSEFPDRRDDESTWRATALLFTQSEDTLSAFSLGMLKRQMIYSVVVYNATKETVFELDPRDLEKYVCRLPIDNGKELWWLWPMGSLLPGESDGEQDRMGSRDQAERSV